MKAIIALVLVMTAAAIGDEFQKEFAEIKTANGKVYKKVIVRKVEPDGISIMHETGAAKLLYDDLSDELQEAFGYDPEAAEEYQRTAQAHSRAAEAEKNSAQAEGEYKRAMDAAKNAAKEGKIHAWLKVQQNPGSGLCLCRWGFVVKEAVIDRRGLSPKVSGHRPTTGKEQDELIAVHGLGQKADGSKWSGTLYPCGVFTYTSVGGGARTVERYATTLDLAMEIMTK